jgi:outer membrane autotransporter protein
LVTLPTGAPGLTINGNGNTLTLNDGATIPTYGRLGIPVGLGGTLNLSDITITGGNHGDLGGAIRVQTGDVNFSGSNGSTVSLSGNTASQGGAIYVQTGDVNFSSGDSGAITLSGNTASSDIGGAIRVQTGDVNFSGSNGSTVTLSGNTASSSGGAIYVQTGDVSISSGDGGVIILTNNSAGTPVLLGGGGAIDTPRGNVFIRSGADGIITLSGNTSVTAGAAILAGGSTYLTSVVVITTGDRGVITVNNNNNATATNSGAIFSQGSMSISGGNASTIALNENIGGALYNAGFDGPLTVTVGDRGTITVNNNTASEFYGAIEGGAVDIMISGGEASTISLNDNIGRAIHNRQSSVSITTGNSGVITLSGNNVTSSISGEGGAIQTTGTVTISSGDNGVITLAENSAISNGGAIDSESVSISSGDNGVITLAENSANLRGGAINSNGDVSISSGDNGFISITRNTASGGTSAGGAIAGANVSISSGDNGTIALTDNTAFWGGAIFAIGNTTLTGALTVSGNTAGSSGGAVFALGDVTLNATGASMISGNSTNGLPDPGVGLTPGGGAIWVGGNMTLNATLDDITFRGNTADGQANAVWFENANVLAGTTGGRTATFNTDTDRSIVFYDPIQNNAANGLITVNKTGAGSVVFDGVDTAAPTAAPAGSTTTRWSQVYGNTTVQAGTFEVRNNAVYGVLATDVSGAVASAFTVNSGATLAGGILGEVRADDFTLNGGLNIAGSAVPGTASGGFSTFTVTSNNVDLTGSQIFFNTLLNDASTQLSDVLVLDLNGSAASGTASIIVNNVGTVGDGAVTTGNGIELVRVMNNGTTTGAFTLGNTGGYIAAGPYRYELFHGSVDASAPENWFLRSTIDCTLDPTNPACASGTGGTVPNYRPETSLYSVLPSMLLGYSNTLLDTLHERVGDEYIGGMNTDAQPVWGRILGTRGRAEDGAAEYHHDTWTAQGGVDLYRNQKTDGSSHRLGVYAAIGTMGADVDHYGKDAGSNRLQGKTLGIYWTHFTEEGAYLDALAQYTWADLNTNPRNTRGFDTRGGITALSLEIGKPFRMDEAQDSQNKRILEPQAQIIYQRGSIDSDRDPQARVRFSDIDSTTLRLGARYADISNAQDKATILWLRPSLLHTFQNEPRTTFSSATGEIPFEFDQSGGSFELAAGIERQRGKGYALFLSGLYRVGLDKDGYDYGLKAGIRWEF